MNENDNVKKAIELYQKYYPMPVGIYIFFGLIDFIMACVMIYCFKVTEGAFSAVFLFLCILMSRSSVKDLSRGWENNSFNLKAERFAKHYNQCNQHEEGEHGKD